jgi:hypothetical protein
MSKSDNWNLKVKAAVGAVTKELADCLHISQRRQEISRLEEILEAHLGMPGNSQADIRRKIEAILPILGGACARMGLAPEHLDYPFIVRLNMKVHEILR